MEKVCGCFGRALLLPFRAVVYIFNPCNWCKNSAEVKCDARNALRKVVDKNARTERVVVVEMCNSSAQMGIKLIEARSGFVAISLSRSSTGKLTKLKQEKIDNLHREYPSIKLSKRERTAVIEIDILDIRNSFHKTNAIIIEIASRITVNLKALSKAVGIHKVYHDRTLVNSIAELLHDSAEHSESPPVRAFVEAVDQMVIIFANKGVFANIRQ